MSPQALADALAERLGLAGLPLDDHDRAALRFDDGDFLQISFCLSQDQVQLYCDVFPLQGHQPPELPAMLLALNTSRVEAALPHFAFDGSERAVVLCASLPLPDATPAGLQRLLEQIRLQAREARAELADCGIGAR